MPNAYIATELPIQSAIRGFDNPSLVCSIVSTENREYNKLSLSISSRDVLFIGYKEQCEKNLKDYPLGVIIDQIQDKII